MTIECAFFGSLVRDAEAKTSKAGKKYLRLNVRTGDGDTAQFINTTVFDAEAIADANRLVKGVRVYIEGRLSLDTWTGQDGVARHGLSATVRHCRLSQIGRNRPTIGDPRRQSDPRASGPERAARNDYGPNGGGSADLNDEIPFAPEVR
jgi:single-stranded DNA-binding protein